jgi:hydroxypyruvate isomerase
MDLDVEVLKLRKNLVGFFFASTIFAKEICDKIKKKNIDVLLSMYFSIM